MRSTAAPTRRYNALYLVASKQVTDLPLAGPLRVHGGYGLRVIDARSHQFVGIFGGISIAPVRFAELMAEYDGAFVTAGARLRAGSYLQAVVALQGLSAPLAGVAATVRL
jgi:hypothetical protein